MNKRGKIIVLVLIIGLFLFSFINAQTTDDEDDKIKNAYQCIKDEIDDSCSNLNTEEQIYTLLALGNYKDCREEFLDSSRNQECWPSSNCKLKDTALALLALDKAGANTGKIESWLLNQTKVADDLIWYLQIEANDATTCSVSYQGSSFNVNIASDKKMLSSAGSCLSISENGFWLKLVSSETCLNNEYTISCDQDFSSTLLYRTQDSSTIHVSQLIHSEPSNGQTAEKVNYRCFQQAGACNYEGSLWSVLALHAIGEDMSVYLPYLDSLKEDNEALFPASFIYILTGDDSLLTEIINDNFKTEFWQVGTYGKYKSTALAFLALQGQEITQVQKAKTYLLGSQNANGCWNNVPDTGFLLYAGWSKFSSSSGGGDDECRDDTNCGAGENCLNGVCVPDTSNNCESNGNFCVPSSSCDGLTFPSQTGCLSFQICCSNDLPSCFEQSGETCDFDEKCDGTLVESSDSALCCQGECLPDIVEPTEYTCGVYPGEQCQSSCLGDTQQDNSLTCPNNQVCCVEKKESGSYWWIWLLIILILIVIIAIIFRDRLRVVIYKTRNRFKKGPAPRKIGPPPFSPPPYPAASSGRPAMARPGAPQNRPAFNNRKPSQRDKEFEETLKKLREMSK